MLGYLRILLASGIASAAIAYSAPSPADNAMTETIVIGHRGASGYRPEHTLAAYALAIEQGADFIEPDLVMTGDGVLVARHENEIGGTTNVADHPEFASRYSTKIIDGQPVSGWFTEDFALKELKTLRARERIPDLRPTNTRFDGDFEIPTFPEVLDLVKSVNNERTLAARAAGDPLPHLIGLYPETKHPTYFRTIGKPLEQPLVDALRQVGYDNRQAPVFIQSFETSSLETLSRMTRVRLIQLLGDARTPFDLATIAGYASGIGAAKELVIPREKNGSLGSPTSLVHDAHQLGLLVHVWTFRAENVYLPLEFRSGSGSEQHGSLDQELDAFLKTGIDGVFSDHPDIAVQTRDRFEASAERQ